MGANSYYPFQNLLFKYVEKDQELYIISKNKVEIQWGEILYIQENMPIELPVGNYETTLHFDAIRNKVDNGYYTVDKETPILIGRKIVYRSSPKSLAGKIQDIRDQIEAELSVLPPASQFYSIEAIVYKADGSSGGQVTTTISHDGQIEVI
jgi:hypothetical protein